MNRVDQFGALFERWQTLGLSRRQFLRLVAVGTSAATLSAIMEACGGSSKSTSTSVAGAPTMTSAPSTSTMVPTTVATTAAGSPAASGHVGAVAMSTAAPFVDKNFVVALNAEPPNLDVHNTGSNAALGVFKCIYEGLVGQDGQMQPTNLLAESWEPSADAKEFTFHLRTGVTFHDGTPFNATAVKDAFARVLAPDSTLLRHSFFGDVIDHFDVIDDSTITLVAKEPFGAMIATLAHPSGGIPSPTAVAKYGQDFGTHPTGTGPYKFTEWLRGDHITLEAYQDYWSKPIGASVSKLTIKAITEPSALGISVQTGDAQFAGPLAAQQALQLKSASGVTVAETSSILGSTLRSTTPRNRSMTNGSAKRSTTVSTNKRC